MTIERAIEDSESCGLVGGGKMGIAKLHLEIFVPEQILDRSRVHPAHDEIVRRQKEWQFSGPELSVSEFINAEREAREKKLGLWQQSNPQPPWEFRKQRR